MKDRADPCIGERIQIGNGPTWTYEVVHRKASEIWVKGLPFGSKGRLVRISDREYRLKTIGHRIMVFIPAEEYQEPQHIQIIRDGVDIGDGAIAAPPDSEGPTMDIPLQVALQ